MKQSIAQIKYQYTAAMQQIAHFFFKDPPTTELYTLSLHDALPISLETPSEHPTPRGPSESDLLEVMAWAESKFTDRKSTRLNSSHSQISYAVFCLKKKKTSATAALKRLRYARQHPCSSDLDGDRSH